MRVAVDFKVLGTEAAIRGMGRYTQQQMFESLRADPSLELFLLLDKPVDAANCTHDWLAMDRVHPIWLELDETPGSFAALPEFEKALIYSHRLGRLLTGLEAEVFHNATPFLNPFYTGPIPCPVVSTCYDLIPLIFPGDYFPDRERRTHYSMMLRNVRQSDRVLCISESAAQDLRHYTGFRADQCDIAYPVIDPAFRIAPPTSEQRTAARMRAAALRGAAQKFLLSVTGIHRSKNIRLLLDAFRLARADARWPGHRLVIVLPARWTLDVFRNRFGAPPDVELLADVEEASLLDLYQAADFVFQPSLYEGFGYPVAEAMHCSAAVIATSTAAIPEVAGDAALMISPTDTEGAAEAMMTLATDESRRLLLQGAARQRAVRFADPRRLGQSTVRSWHKAAAAATATPPRRVALWSSMPPLDCGIADYTAELAEGLAQHRDVDVYTDGTYQPSPFSTPNIHFRHPRDFDPTEGGLERSIFQVQAREYQAFMYPYLMRHGGTVMMHDLAISGAVFGLSRHFGRQFEFEDGMLAADGPDAVRDLGVALARSGGRIDDRLLAPVFDRHRLLKWLMNASDQMFFHTRTLASDALARHPEAKVSLVRQGYRDSLPKVRNLPLAQWRQLLGVSAGGLIVGCPGIVGRAKRIERLIDAFGLLHRQHPDSLLLVLGRNYDSAYRTELKDRIALSPARERIVMRDYVPPDLFHASMAMMDVVVNLRWPSLGGLSAILLRALAAGKPVIVSDIPEWYEAGGDACLRVKPDERETATIAGHLLELTVAARRQALGSVARRWYLEHATLEVMVHDHLTGGTPLKPHGKSA